MSRVEQLLLWWNRTREWLKEKDDYIRLVPLAIQLFSVETFMRTMYLWMADFSQDAYTGMFLWQGLNAHRKLLASEGKMDYYRDLYTWVQTDYELELPLWLFLL